MDNLLENNFINNFIVKEKQQRLIYEFSNLKKRKTALLRFSHSVEDIVINKYIKQRCNVDNVINNLLLPKNVYIISLGKLEGELCKNDEAINHLKEQYMPVIIIDNDIVIIKSENEESKNNIFILKKNC